MTKALLVIDIQNDYFPGGKMELVGAVAAAENGARVQRQFREAGLSVIHVQHIALSPTATFFLPDTSVRAANDAGYKVTLIGDACATKNLEFGGVEVAAAEVQVAYLAAIDGSFATVVDTDDWAGI